MNILRKLAAFLAIGVVTFVLASGAALGADKQYSLTVSPGSTSPATLTFTFTNLGNSSFNSLSLTIPSGYTVPTGGITPSRGVASVVSGAIQVNAINLPTGSGQFVTVTLTGVTAGTCAAGATGTWQAQPWTGSSVGSGQTFSIKPANSYPQTTLVPTCYTLTYLPGANGTISGASPQSIAAGGSGTAVTANPNPNYRFTNWSPDGSAANPRTDTNVLATATYTANFVLLPKITASAGSGGSISSPGVTYVAYHGAKSYTITPTDNTWRILDVLVDGISAGTGSTYGFTDVTTDHSIVASFKQNTLTIGVPTDPAVAGTQFAINVGYDGPQPSYVTLGLSCTTAGASSQTVTSPAVNPVPFLLTFNKPDTCTITATAPNFKDATAVTGFTVYSGTLDCGQKASTSTDIDVVSDWSYPRGAMLPSGGWSLIRGKNKPDDTTECNGPVPYTFSMAGTGGSQTASFAVPSTGQLVSAQYVVVWAPATTTDGWFDKRPRLAWKSNGSGLVYMKALACLSDPMNLSTVPRGNLFDLMPMIPNIAPYNQEPLLSTYGVNVKAKMCISQHGWTSIGPADANGTDTLIQSWDKVIDLGDGFMTND